MTYTYISNGSGLGMTCFNKLFELPEHQQAFCFEGIESSVITVRQGTLL